MKRLVSYFALVPVLGLSGSFAASLSADWQTTPPSSSDAWQFYAGLDPASPDVTSAARLTYYGPAFITGTEMWAPGSGGFPFIAKNISGTDLTVGSGTLQSDNVYVHPADFGTGTLGVAYKVPENGVYDVSGYIQRLHTGDVDWWLDVNGSSFLQGNTGLLNANETEPLNLSNISLSTGDFVFLIVGANGISAGDSTGVGLTITKQGSTSVPDSGSTMALLLGAVAGIGCCGRKTHGSRQIC